MFWVHKIFFSIPSLLGERAGVRGEVGYFSESTLTLPSPYQGEGCGTFNCPCGYLGNIKYSTYPLSPWGEGQGEG
jgi:hypothetical protein